MPTAARAAAEDVCERAVPALLPLEALDMDLGGIVFRTADLLLI